MRVLWFTNLPIGEAPSLLGISRSIFGGWLDGSFRQLASLEEVAVSVAFPASDARASSLSGKLARYYPFPPGSAGSLPHPRTVACLQQILDSAKPDIVHVFGTELPHAAVVMRLCRERSIPTALQIQGLAGSVAEHYMGWLPAKVTRRAAPIEILRRRTLRQLRDRFDAAGKLETEALQLADHILGRTAYDLAWVRQVNSDAQYYVAEETLRDAFYDGVWSVEECDRFSLFLSQAVAPYKGAHMAIRAMPAILERFPQAQLYIAGPSPIGVNSLTSVVGRSAYGWHLRNLLKQLNLTNKVHFTGPLDEKSMHARLLQSHVFLSCSSVENSSNSLSEAQLLGVPAVASYVGGIPDMVEHRVSGYLYQGDAPYMLAHFAMEILGNDALAASIGRESRVEALRRHNKVRNLHRLLDIYDTILVRESSGGHP